MRAALDSVLLAPRAVQPLISGAFRPRRSCKFGHVRTISASTVLRKPAVASCPIGENETDRPVLDPDSAPTVSRREKLRDARPFSDFLTDTFNRQHDYLRISVTERCNLRCVYCMPEEGVPLSPPRELLTTPEIVLLSSVFVSQGVTKIRLTGGEPTVRRDIVPLMQQIGDLRRHGLRELCLTTNGLSLHRKLESMVEAGLTGVNLSLDTLDPWQFQIMTRRKGFDAVQRSIARILELNRAGAGIRLKINCVVMRGVNDREILPFVEMTREKDIEIRFIEYMPFDGNKWSKGKMFSYEEMLEHIRERYPTLEKVRDHKNDTSKTWHIPGFAGRLGFITSMTHNFCGTCNRLRITSDGNLKVCLFGNAEVSLRDILRKVNNGEPIDEEALATLKQLALARRQDLSNIDVPLTLAPNSKELLEVIGAAVKRKKAKHAGIGELEHMKNRPMILIDSIRPRGMTPPSVIWRPVGQAGATFTRTPTTITTTPWRQPAFTPASGPFTHHAPPQPARLFSSMSGRALRKDNDSKTKESQMTPPPPPPHTAPAPAPPKLTHVSASGSAHMVSISSKAPTSRTATAACTVRFSAGSPAPALIRANQVRKGDVLGVARVAGIMAAKRTPDLIPLCHPVAISHVSVELDVVVAAAAVEVRATVECDGKTGVEMEALTAAGAAALTVYDMCKAVDKGMRVEGLRVVFKDGGKSGRWVEGVQDQSGV